MQGCAIIDSNNQIKRSQMSRLLSVCGLAVNMHSSTDCAFGMADSFSAVWTDK